MPSKLQAVMPTVDASRLAQLDSLRAAVEELARQKAALTCEIETLKRRREELLELPLPMEDATKLVEEHVDRWKSAFSRVLKNQLGFLTERYYDELPAHLALLNVGGQREIDQQSIVFILGTAIKGRIADELRAWPWPAETGPSRAERKREIARLDAEIEQREAQLAQLTRAATEAGVKL